MCNCKGNNSQPKSQPAKITKRSGRPDYSKPPRKVVVTRRNKG